MDSGQGGIDASIVLSNLSKHLSNLAKNIKEIEGATSELLDASSSKTTSTAVLHLQSLDFARQSLEDCSILVEHLSVSHATKKQQIGDGSNLRERIKLESTKDLLDAGETQNRDGSAGEVDVF